MLISIFVKATSAIPVLYDGCCYFIIECSLFCRPKKGEKHFNYERKIGKKRRREKKKARSQLQTNSTRGSVKGEEEEEKGECENKKTKDVRLKKNGCAAQHTNRWRNRLRKFRWPTDGTSSTDANRICHLLLFKIQHVYHLVATNEDISWKSVSIYLVD